MFTKPSANVRTLLGLSAAALLLSPLSVHAAPGTGAANHQKVQGETLDWPTGDVQRADMSSGLLVNALPKSTIVYDEIVKVSGSGWIRLYFGEVMLDKGSVIHVTSLLDHDTMTLDQGMLEQWGYTTAYFNGDAVRVELEAGPNTTDNMVSIELVGFNPIIAHDRGDGCGICGPDDRAPASDENFARLMPVGCSATLYNAESCMVTAGHCLGGSSAVVQFNVPESSSNCSTNNPPAADQFPVLTESGLDGGVGADYGAMRIGTNSSGQTPYDRYGTFVPIANSVPGSGSIDITGYGVDDECTRSQTEQYHGGPISYTDSTTVVYDVDITFGNSGSSILYNGSIIGVVTHCSYGCENYGTRVDVSGFVSARSSACEGDGGGGGECAVGEIEDCNGNCCPADWVSDGYCDDGSYEWNGVPIYLNCDEFDCDGGDCPAESCGGGGGDGTGACCVGTECADDLSSDECSTFGGTYQGDDSSCNSTDCGGGGGECPDGWSQDCQGTCFPNEFFDAWLGDGYCDDGTYIPYDYGCDECPPGVGMYLNCDEFSCDNGDCPAESCGGGGGGDGTGACCVGTECADDLSSDECSTFGGTYQGDDSSCNSTDCGGGGGECPDGWSQDCQGTCFPNEVFDAWLGDGYCDDGTYIPYDYGCDECPPGVGMYLNCDEFSCDNGDCPAESCGGGGGDGTGACCVGTECADDLSSDECSTFGGTYQGDDSSCNSTDCGGGGGGDGDTCADAIEANLGVNAFDTTQNSDSGFGEPDDSQCADTYLDWSSSPDSWFSWTAPGDGTASFTTCDVSSFDTSVVLYSGSDCGSLQQIACNGDAADSSGCQDYHSQIDGISVGAGELYYIRVGGWQGATGAGTLTIDGDFDKPQEGACCVGFECVQSNQSDCNVLGGEFQGTGSSCGTEDICGTPDCDGDGDGDGQVNVNDLLGVIGEWGCVSGCDFDVTGDGQVNVSDVLMVIGSWGPCF